MYYCVIYHDKILDQPRMFLPHDREELLQCLERITRQHILLGVVSHEEETPLLTTREELQDES